MPASTSHVTAFHLRAVARQPAGDVQEAAKIGCEQASRAGLDDIADLGLIDGARDPRVFDREGAAEAAAHFGLLHLGERKPVDAFEQSPRRIAHLQLAQARAGIVIGDVSLEPRGNLVEPKHLDEETCELVALGGKRAGSFREVRIVSEQ
jgi:hypothetical protein